jgi:hypothetical protein
VTIKVTTSGLKKNGVDYYAKKLHNALMSGKTTKVVEYSQSDVDINGNFKTKAWNDFEEKLFAKVAENYGYGVTIDVTSYSGVDIVCKSRAASYGLDLVFSKAVAKAYKTAVTERKAGASKAVSSISDSLAQEIHKTLMSKKQYVLYTSLSPKQAADQLNEKLGAVNGQGIGIPYYDYKYNTNGSVSKSERWDYTKISGTDTYKIVIDKSEATEYYYCVKIATEIYDWYAKTYPLSAGISGMNDIADLDKVSWVSLSMMFDSIGASRITPNIWYDDAKAAACDAGKTYTVAAKYAPTLENLYKGTAKGVCEDFAKLEVTLISHWGIQIYFRGDVKHAWSDGKATDYDGVMRSFRFDYKLKDSTYVHHYYTSTVGTDTNDASDDTDAMTDDTAYSDGDSEEYGIDEDE